MMLVYAVIFITAALIFYTLGVFAEKRQGALKGWHLIVFWAGFIFDTLGTTFMSKISGDRLRMDMHGITGLLAIVLMLFHVAWATMVIFRNDIRMKKSFHKLSIVVWMIWLIPYLSGTLLGMSR